MSVAKEAYRQFIQTRELKRRERAAKDFDFKIELQRFVDQRFPNKDGSADNNRAYLKAIQEDNVKVLNELVRWLSMYINYVSKYKDTEEEIVAYMKLEILLETLQKHIQNLKAGV